MEAVQHISGNEELPHQSSVESPAANVGVAHPDTPEDLSLLQSLSHPVELLSNGLLSAHSEDPSTYDSGTVVRRLTDPPKPQKPPSRPSNRREMSSALRKGFHGVFGKSSEASKSKSKKDKFVLSE